jgi:hypothetical protein
MIDSGFRTEKVISYIEVIKLLVVTLDLGFT